MISYPNAQPDRLAVLLFFFLIFFRSFRLCFYLLFLLSLLFVSFSFVPLLLDASLRRGHPAQGTRGLVAVDGFPSSVNDHGPIVQ